MSLDSMELVELGELHPPTTTKQCPTVVTAGQKRRSDMGEGHMVHWPLGMPVFMSIARDSTVSRTDSSLVDPPTR
jgi:hypothetical protein